MSSPPGTLKISFGGDGFGSVTVSAPGLNQTCEHSPAHVVDGDSCQFSVPLGTVVSVGATPGLTSVLNGWSDSSCAASGSCPVTAAADSGLRVDFQLEYNVAFVSSSVYDVPELPRPGAAANQECARLAAAAGLHGARWVAWLSADGPSTAPDDDITPAKFLQSSGGWVRRDGLPFARSRAELLRGDVLRPLVFDENGTGASDAWSGTSQDGGTLKRLDGVVADDCNNWTSTDASLDASLASSSAVGFYWLNFFSRCSDGRALQCFGDDPAGPIAEAPVPGRSAFLSSTPFTPNQGIAAADRLCQADACAAGLTGSSNCATNPGSARRFLSYLYTSAQPAPQRFDLSGPTWVRPDGLAWLLAASDLVGDAPARLTGLNVLANGAFDNSGAGDFIWIGGTGANESCQDWTSSTGTGLAGSVGQVNGAQLFKTDTDCDREARVLCLEQ